MKSDEASCLLLLFSQASFFSFFFFLNSSKSKGLSVKAGGMDVVFFLRCFFFAFH